MYIKVQDHDFHDFFPSLEGSFSKDFFSFHFSLQIWAFQNKCSIVIYMKNMWGGGGEGQKTMKKYIFLKKKKYIFSSKKIFVD